MPRIPFPFPVVVVTAPTERSAEAYQEELQARLSKRYFAVCPGLNNDESSKEENEQELILLAVADPLGKRVGSGGGTLNALVHVHSYLQVHHFVSSAGQWPAILMVHSGGDSQRSPTNSVCGKAWSCLNSHRKEDGGSNTPIDLLLEQFTQLFAGGVPSGALVVASSDVLLVLPPWPVDWASQRGVVGLAASVPAALGPNHGVYVTATSAIACARRGRDVEERSEDRKVMTQRVMQYLQKASLVDLTAKGAVSTEGNVLIDTGVLFFCPQITRELMSLPKAHAVFRRCCSRGETEGGTAEGRVEAALRLELYTDMLLALSDGLGQDRASYVGMDGASSEKEAVERAGQGPGAVSALREARGVLWDCLRRWPFSALAPRGALFGHLGTTQELQAMMTLKMTPFSSAFRLARRVCCVVEGEEKDSAGAQSGEEAYKKKEGAVVLNSILTPSGGLCLGDGSIVEHSVVEGESRLEVGAGTLVSGLCHAPAQQAKICIGPGVVVQEVRLNAAEGTGQPGRPLASPYVVSVLSLHDNVKATYGKEPQAGVWNRPWGVVLDMLQVDAGVIWPHSRLPVDSNVSTTKGISAVKDSDFQPRPRTLWHACLFPAVGEGGAPARGTGRRGAWCWQQAYASQGKIPSREAVVAWRQARRLSLSDILAQAEPTAEFRWRRTLEARILTRTTRETSHGEGELKGASLAKSARRDIETADGRLVLKAPGRLEGDGRRNLVLESLKEALRTGPSLEDLHTKPLDAIWRDGLPSFEEKLWLVVALEEWAEDQVLNRAEGAKGSDVRKAKEDNAVDAGRLSRSGWCAGDEDPLSVLASTCALLARVLEALAQQIDTVEEEDKEINGTEQTVYNAQWTQAVLQLTVGGTGAVESRREAFKEMRTMRVAWMAGEKWRVREVAAHYDKTTFALIKRQVASVHRAVSCGSASKVQVGRSVVAEAPARIDLSGGWSDTPPISFELGGEVTNLAVQLKGQRPIGARVTILKDHVLVLQARQADGDVTERVCRTMADLREGKDEDGKGQEGQAAKMDKKFAACPTALVRWCLVYFGVLPNEGERSFTQIDQSCHDQAEADGASRGKERLSTLLAQHIGGGLRVETWSMLPTGSGLGTSSILVGTVLAALGRACGRAYSVCALNHAVLEVEQLMDVGGGWQDQVGGLVGGAKRAYSAPGLPLRVKYETLPLCPAVRARWERHLLLIYTGRARLASNIVRSVVRRYYAQSPEVLVTLQGLVHGARSAADALQEGDVKALGKCLNNYRKQKLTMAPSSEPEHVRRLIKILETRALGMVTCGAGGGGFLLMLTRLPDDADKVQNIVEGHHIDAYVATLNIDEEGLRIRVEEAVGLLGVGGA